MNELETYRSLRFRLKLSEKREAAIARRLRVATNRTRKLELRVLEFERHVQQQKIIEMEAVTQLEEARQRGIMLQAVRIGRGQERSKLYAMTCLAICCLAIPCLAQPQKGAEKLLELNNKPRIAIAPISVRITALVGTPVTRTRDFGFKWNSPPEYSRFRIEYGQVSGLRTNSVEVVNSTNAILKLPDKAYYFAVKSVDASGNVSDPSEELLVFYIGSPFTSEVGIPFPTTTDRRFQIQATTDGKTWANLGLPVDGNGAQMVAYFKTDPPMKMFRVVAVKP